MCAGGIVFAGVDEVVFGLSIPEVARYLPQIHLSSQSIFDASWRRIPTTGGVLNEECRALFERFA
jgi:tRNA(Arg) A34 adenosine deaminase TadA